MSTKTKAIFSSVCLLFLIVACGFLMSMACSGHACFKPLMICIGVTSISLFSVVTLIRTVFLSGLSEDFSLETTGNFVGPFAFFFPFFETDSYLRNQVFLL